MHVWMKPKLHTHREYGPRFHPLRYNSYIRSYWLAPLSEDVGGWAGRPAQPRTQHDCHHDTKVKPEAPTGVIELLAMGGKTPETYWAVNKRQDNKLENCCIWLVIYLNHVSNVHVGDTTF
jgi:hypothetical protein